MNNKKNKIFDIEIVPLSKKLILEKILKFIEKPKGFFHIVSLNPENLVIAQENYYFKRVLCQAPLKIVDGVGIVIASKILGFEAGERIAGVDLMKEIMDLAFKIRLRVMLIGGKPELANSIAVCYQKKYPEAKFLGIEGIKDIKNKNKTDILKEEKEIFKIVVDFKPQVVFVAFGSPDQELWIERHRNKFNDCVVMGVGGAFDFLSGKIIRAPEFI
ncbi:MAG: WecB/TagA/CpsF family glycosyltransferase, partial [Patescibacteria group bacterium]|nr:WecB/TagA/CpsF family glycosyltransferase [Patescibacteria group bacterium]